MNRTFSCAIALVMVVGAWTTAEAQTYTYRLKQQTSSRAGDAKATGTITVKKLRRTAEGYVAYHGTKTIKMSNGKVHRETVAMIEVATSKGTRVFAVSQAQKPFWMYVFRQTKRGITVTMLNAWGFTEKAKRVVGPNLYNPLTVSGKNKYGAWSARVTFDSNNDVGWTAGKQTFLGNGCRVGNTYVIGINKKGTAKLFCYTPKGRVISGARALTEGRPLAVTETLTLQRMGK